MKSKSIETERQSNEQWLHLHRCMENNVWIAICRALDAAVARKEIEKYGSTQSQHTQLLWKHEWRSLFISLVVDDFGVKYAGKEHADHLIYILINTYEVSEYCQGHKYCVLSFNWDYEKRNMHLFIPGYAKKAFVRFKCKRPTQSQDQPHQHIIPMYHTNIQYAKPNDDSCELNKTEKKYVQQVVGTF